MLKAKKSKTNSKSDGHSGVANYVAPNARLILKKQAGTLTFGQCMQIIILQSVMLSMKEHP